MKQSHRQAATAAPGAGPVEGPAWTPGLVSYMTPESESSLYRNGKVFTRRDRDGNDAGYEGVVTEELAVAIGDARSLEGGRRRTLDVHGFELLDRPLARPDLDFYNHEQVVRDYYSADLDFSVVEGDLEAAYATIEAALTAVTGAIDTLNLTDDEPKRIGYQGPLGRHRTLKLDIADDELVLNVDNINLLQRWPDLPETSAVRAYPLGQNAALDVAHKIGPGPSPVVPKRGAQRFAPRIERLAA